MNKTLPIYNIKQFRHVDDENNFYANEFIPHLTEHHFTVKPHKHDFYLSILFTKGKGTHNVDFTNYQIKPGTIFMLNPGQVHSWKLSKDIDGYVFFHTKAFYDEGFTSDHIKNYPFFNSIQNQPFVIAKKNDLVKIESLFKEIFQEYTQQKLLKFSKLHALVNMVYIELTRLYNFKNETESEKYLISLQKFESLIDKHYKDIKFPAEYASLMNITERHLNRITKTCLNKTPTELIADRIILEAKRMFIHSTQSVSEVAADLGYYDSSYFSRLFKKKTTFSPKQFLLSHQ